VASAPAEPVGSLMPYSFRVADVFGNLRPTFDVTTPTTPGRAD
jgi:hypothetical protein